MAADEVDDVLLTSAFTGLPTNMLLPAIRAASLDPTQLDEQITAADAGQMYGGDSQNADPKRWQDIFSAGHTVSADDRARGFAELVDELVREHEDCR